MSGTKKVTKLRRNLDNLEGNLNIVSDYADGKLSVREIAQKYQTSENNVGLTTKKFWKKLTNMRESRVLKSPTPEFKDTKLALHELQNTDLINKKFIMLLSEPDSALLSDAETTYAWVYVHTGDIIEALKTSGLDVGLFKEKGRDTRFSFDRSLIIRGHYLNSKVNVAEYIKTLREQRLIDANVGKARIQSELVEQLEYMKASGDTRVRKDILRCIELLGKTVGAFTERIEIREVDPANALDELIELAQNAEVSEIDEKKVKEIST